MGYINPLLRLPAARALLGLSGLQRRAVAKVCRGLREEANAEAELAWKRRKGPMAAYWRAVSTYARHLAHALEQGEVELAAVAVPEGFVLVPKEATPQMLEAFRFLPEMTDRALQARYQELLGVAPQPIEEAA
ncbi:hypothetical protein [Cupriavidus pinatubonensis]|uniref:hypothetical protein n=1 Tax=Cupriavidus pinatubonensis TaxID=248026 RepID=UPI001FD03572|nr:hypothetical protein [Cupriavidus pinatubonensis]